MSPGPSETYGDAMADCDCGFTFEAFDVGEAPVRVRAAAAAVASTLVGGGHDVRERPVPGRWSSLEYGAHIRDVLLTIRERLVLGLLEDNPAFASLYRDERVELGLYAEDTPEDIAEEVTAAAAMFSRLLSAIEPASLDRLVQYGNPVRVERTLGWMGAQAVHETEHHLADMVANAVQLAGG